MTKQRLLDKEQTEKQKVIREAYGEHWDKVKDFITETGWIDMSEFHVYPQHLNIEKEDCEIDQEFWRPKSLKGIENNNGWFSIKEHGLPKEKGNYDFLISEDYRINAEDLEITTVYVSESLVLNKYMA